MSTIATFEAGWVMAKKPSKIKKRPRQPKPRAGRRDESGVPLTSDRRPFTILPSDFAVAMRQPAGSPTESNLKPDPAKPTTVIPELNAIEFTPFAFQTVLRAIHAADQVQINHMNPTGGPNLRYRIEIAAAFLSHVLEHAYDAGVAKGGDPKELVNLAMNLVIRRAEEIYGQSGA